jgi:uncharacterized protein YodC (DUF2158 family)
MYPRNYFEVGDVVQLKSGGPQMTVDLNDPHFDPNGKDVRTDSAADYVMCIWFDKDGLLQKAVKFRVNVLTKIVAPASPQE